MPDREHPVQWSKPLSLSTKKTSKQKSFCGCGLPLPSVFQTVNNRGELSCRAFMKEAACKASRSATIPASHALGCHRKRIVVRKLFLKAWRIPRGYDFTLVP